MSFYVAKVMAQVDKWHGQVAAAAAASPNLVRSPLGMS